MKLTVQQIAEAAFALSYEDREALLDSIYSSLHPPPKEWHAELDRRSDELLSGKVKAIPWEEVQAEGRRIIEEGRSSRGSEEK